MEEFIAKVMEFIANPQTLLISGIVLEVIFRFVKTDKPKSVLIVIADGSKMIGNALVSISSFLDKIIGQRLN